jgi:hypothetical protein
MPRITRSHAVSISPVQDVPPVLRDEDKMQVEVVSNSPDPADIKVGFPACRHRLGAICD